MEIDKDITDLRLDDLDEYESRILLDNQLLEKGRSQVVTDLDLVQCNGNLKLVFNPDFPFKPITSTQYQQLACSVPIPGFLGAKPVMDYKADYMSAEPANWTKFSNYKIVLASTTQADLETQLFELRSHRLAKRMTPRPKQT